jgi:hypothetical protein
MTKLPDEAALEEPFLSMASAFANPETQALFREIYKVSGYLPHFQVRQIMKLFHDIMGLNSTSIRFEWDKRPNRKWKQDTLGFVYHMRMATFAAFYHLENLIRIENEIRLLSSRFDLKHLGAITIGGGENHLIVDFEFHAFVISFRRAMDQFARILFACTKSLPRSFSSVSKLFSIPPSQRFVDRAQLEALLNKATKDFSFCLSDGTNKSIRDRIVHRDYVPSGTINVSVHGITLASADIGAHMPIVISEFCRSKTDEFVTLLTESAPLIT